LLELIGVPPPTIQPTTQPDRVLTAGVSWISH
jgi:hypothetical protein